MRLKLMICVALAALMAGCCSQCRKTQKMRKPLVGTEWRLIQLNGSELTAYENPESYTLHFTPEGDLYGMGACNRIMGQYTTNSDRSLKIGTMASTRILCRDHAREVAFLEALERTTHYDMDGPMMLLLSDGYLVALFQAVNPSEAEESR